MCGITGYINYASKLPENVIEKMNNTLYHRGPDGGNVYHCYKPNYELALGHRRLSIIDLSDLGSQPMHYKHYTIVFNGEIYNYKEIKDRLVELGHSFISNSDTEVVLHAFEQYGKSCVDEFIGMFTFCLSDSQENKVLIFRDRAGVKPLFYYTKEDTFIFGSELKAFHQHPNFKKQINNDSLALYLQYGYVPAPHTIFDNTYKLKPGHYIEIDLNSKIHKVTKYWDVYECYNQPNLQIDFETAKVETEKLLTSACQYRMVSDVPVGVFLSGGYDSSLVTALLQINSTNKINTFTIGFENKKYNEAEHAKLVANHLGTNHHEYYCTENDALSIIDDLPYYYDEPFADSSAIPTTLVSKMAKQKVTVCLSADAGDEIFAGYNRYDYIMKYGNRIKKIPVPIRKIAAGMMNLIDADSIPLLNKKYLFHSRYEKVKQFLKNSDDYSVNKILSTQFDTKNLQSVLKTKYSDLETAFDSKELKADFYNTLNYVMAVDYQTYMVDDILQKVDRATMSVSLEGREPLLDHRIINWAAQLPNNFKYNNGVKKFILREIVHQYIPKEIMNRPKMGFAIPLENWIEVNFKEKVGYYFSNSFLEKQNLFNLKQTQQLIDSFYSGKKERAEKIWFMLMFQMWYEKWMM